MPILFVIAFSNQCSGQHDSSYIGLVKNYIHFVDSYYHHTNTFELNKKDTSSYIATKKEEGYYIDSLYNKIGWWDITTTSDTKKDSIFKITCVKISYEYKMFIYKYFYYRSNKLVYAEIELRDKSNKMEIKYSAKELYSSGNLIFRENKIDSLPQEYMWVKELNMYTDGNNYIDRYFSEK